MYYRIITSSKKKILKTKLNSFSVKNGTKKIDDFFFLFVCFLNIFEFLVTQ